MRIPVPVHTRGFPHGPRSTKDALSKRLGAILVGRGSEVH